MRFSTLLPVAALVAVVAAAPRELTARQQCTTGSIQCCESTYEPTSSEATELLGAIGVVIGDLLGLVASGCSSSGVTVGGGTTCTQKPLCCDENYFGGISVGCSPIGVSV